MSNLQKVQMAMLAQDVHDKFTSTDVQLAQIVTNIKSFGAKCNANYYNNGNWYEDSAFTILAHDDSDAIRDAINSVPANVLDSLSTTKILCPGRSLVTKQITINTTRICLEGKMISTFSGITLYVQPLHNGVNDLPSSFSKFYLNNFTLLASGTGATQTGTGIFIKQVYGSLWNNVYITGFKQHIQLSACYMNTLKNFSSYALLHDTDNPTWLTQQRGISISSDDYPQGADGGSDGLTIDGGWISGMTLDFTNISASQVMNLDIEPASNTVITGDGNIFMNNRFERFTYWVQDDPQTPAIPNFSWFQVGSNNKFINNRYHQTGSSNDNNAPMFLIKGDNNEIEIPVNGGIYNAGRLKFDTGAKGNTIHYKMKYVDYVNSQNLASFVNENDSIIENNQNNRIIYYDDDKRVEVNGDCVVGFGKFDNYCAHTDDLTHFKWDTVGLSKAACDIPLPTGRTNANAFCKCTLTSSSGQRQIYYMSQGDDFTLTEGGTFTLSALVYIPSSTSTGLLCCGKQGGGGHTVNVRDKWVPIRVRCVYSAGNYISPAFYMPNGVTGDIFYIGEISVCKGEVSAYGLPATTTFASVGNPHNP